MQWQHMWNSIVHHCPPKSYVVPEKYLNEDTKRNPIQTSWNSGKKINKNKMEFHPGEDGTGTCCSKVEQKGGK